MNPLPANMAGCWSMCKPEGSGIQPRLPAKPVMNTTRYKRSPLAQPMAAAKAINCAMSMALVFEAIAPPAAVPRWPTTPVMPRKLFQIPISASICPFKYRPQRHYIRNTPNLVSGMGAFIAALKPSAKTRRVSAGSITPSSHKRAVAK